MRLLTFLATAVALVATACKYSPPEPKVQVEQAWVRLPVVPGRPGTAYFTLISNNDPTKLVSVTSPNVERIELHETVTEAGVARMRPSEALIFPTNLELTFAPGGRHAMLFGIDPSLGPGDTIPLTFHLEPMRPVTIEADAMAAGAAAPHDASH